MRSVSILLLTFFISLPCLSQQTKEIWVQLLDAETKEPISFATVLFKGTSRGVIADYDGQFRLPFVDINNVPDLVVTALGYNDLELSPKTLNPTEINIVEMLPQAESLDAVILNVTKNNRQKALNVSALIKQNKKILGKEIVQKAIDRISENLDDKAHSLIGYYRDYQLVSDEYFNLNEGILEQFDAGITTNKISNVNNRNAFYSLQTNPEFKKSEQYAKAYDGESKYVENADLLAFGGNELSILNVHNPIRNYNQNSFSYVYTLNKDFIPNHIFSKEGFVFDEDNPIVNVSFTTLTNTRKGVQQRVQGSYKPTKLKVSGVISISLKDYAIHGFNYTMYDFNQRNPLFNVRIEYKQHDQKMYLNYISFNNRFTVTDDFVFREEKITYDKESQSFEVLLNNDVESKNIKKRNFKIKLDGKKVIVKSIKVISSKRIQVFINDFDNSLSELFEDDMKNLEFVIKGIKDVGGRSIYKSREVTGYQFREFFTQEIFKNKDLDTSLKFAAKGQSLLYAPLNVLGDTTPYIVNSPLEKRRMNVQN
ncbi:carboxypeptidase-like regulatory domain-containing protein [Winogradskyella jejuensis]|uniref:CarboxypepD_reg-like domain-containing protein n=1 Tax=Winogradskyella jejuensis TaxID=1089305 RepID=A0A1M5JXK6_9FLAO|nr:carboxypeptidase-like regulatory domain-containing protein [Winogradskyella jejuensis]SHG45274.1 CarboxypepD_reg-like domain-containing protein [Winogradskyella jejuensis]